MYFPILQSLNFECFVNEIVCKRNDHATVAQRRHSKHRRRQRPCRMHSYLGHVGKRMSLLPIMLLENICLHALC